MNESDDLEGVRFDDDFVRGGVYEPPARTRAAIARYGDDASSWRQAAPLRPGRSSAAKPRRARGGTGRNPAPPARYGTASRAETQRPSPIFIALLAVTAGVGYLVWAGHLGRAGMFFFVMCGWIVTLCLHEFGHAATGFHGGDHSVATKGYLRLDPRRYQHPILSIVLPVVFFIAGGIGFPGGAVWIDRSAIRSRLWRSATSFAGPLTNALCAAACLAPFALDRPGPGLRVGTGLFAHPNFALALALLAALQIFSVVLNLLPIPGLDGWGAIEPFLDQEVAHKARRFPTPALFIVLFLLLRLRPLSTALWYVPLHVSHAAGVPNGFIQAGWALVKFWNTPA